MAVLGVQGVAGQHGVLHVDGVQKWLERWNLVALGGDLTLGQDHAVVVHRGQQLDRSGRGGAGAADCLAVDRDRPQSRLRRRLGLFRPWRSGLEVSTDGRIQRVAVDALEQATDGGGVRRRPDAGERSAGKPSTPRTGCGASPIHSPIAMRDRAPVRTAAAAAHNRGSSGYRRPRRPRGSGTQTRKRRRSAASCVVAQRFGRARFPSPAGMGDDVRAGTVSLGSHGSSTTT